MNNLEMIRKNKAIVNHAFETLSSNEQYQGILICEGTKDSVDVELYKRIYPLLYVIPAGGFTEVKRLVSFMRRRLHGYRVFGIIDRDSCSKAEVRRLKKQDVYCTKLPFIENIISCPEVIRILCSYTEMDYDKCTNIIRKRLLYILSRKLREALPINIPIAEGEPIQSVTIKIKKYNGDIVEKTVNESNIIYSYRDKAVANETADVLRIIGRRQYYKFFINCLNHPDLEERIIKATANYLPIIEIKDKDDEYF